MSNTKKISYLAMGVALYVALAHVVKIPIIAHIQTDLGYVAFGLYCALFGWPAFIVGTLGCIIESLLFTGFFPTGWTLGQVLIGIVCGITYRRLSEPKLSYTVIKIAVTIFAVFIGVAVIKTIVECAIWSLPLGIKFARNCIATAADIPPMLVGLFLGERFKKEGWKYG